MNARGRVRVLRLIARLNIGGPAIHATLLTERLDPARYESMLVTGVEARTEGNYLALRQKSVNRLVRLPALGREIGLRDAVALVQLVRLLRRARPHIVHTHTAKAGTLGRIAAWLAGVPVVVHTYHGHVFRGYFSPARTRVFLAIERWLARHTDRLLAVSESVRSELLAFGLGRPEQFVVMPLGLDLDWLMGCEERTGQLRSELAISPGAPLVGIVARLVPVKAHEVFFAAASIVARRVPESRFIVVGDGEQRPELEALVARRGLANRVHFLGWRADLDRIYADLDVVALTSRNEGSPVSLIEAMAAGKPVVATRVGGVPDLVEDFVTGFLVPPGDVETMAQGICALVTDPERARMMGRAGRKRASPAYSAERLVADMDRLYTDLLPGTTP